MNVDKRLCAGETTTQPDPMIDPRHGTVAGYNRIPCRERCCRDAMARYRRGREWDTLSGRPRIIAATGTRRRIEALMTLGWSQATIADRLGMDGNNLTRLRNSPTLTRAIASRVATLYDELSMRLPAGNAQAIAYVRNLAQRRGYLPPLAWDDIDDPTEQPRRGSAHVRKDDIDPVAVDRAVAGDHIRLTKAERAAVVARLRAAGWSMSRIEEHTGITKVERYIEREEVAS